MSHMSKYFSISYLFFYCSCQCSSISPYGSFSVAQKKFHRVSHFFTHIHIFTDFLLPYLKQPISSLPQNHPPQSIIPAPTVAMLFPIALVLLLLATNIGQGAPNVINVTVGQDETLLFKPRSMHAEPGDYILFYFHNVRLPFPSLFPLFRPIDGSLLSASTVSQFHRWD